MTARWPLLVVTFGAERRSTPFCWLRPRSTTWNCGLVKTPASPKIPGATAVLPSDGNKSASSAFALTAAPQLLFPEVTPPPDVPSPGIEVPRPPTASPLAFTQGKAFELIGVLPPAP